MKNSTTGFKIEELLSQEERAICYAVANRMSLDKRSVNQQLAIAKKLK